MKYIKLISCLVLIIIIFGCNNGNDKKTEETQGDNEIHSVILMIPDGASESILTLARWYKNYEAMQQVRSKKDMDNYKFEPLCVDSLLCGNVRTYSIDAPIGESAASGSAYATGYKTQAAHISVSQDNLEDIIKQGKLVATKDKIYPDDKTKLLTVLEAAQKGGRSAGLVVTCALQDATPAVFAAHCPARDSFNIIAKQEAEHHLDVALGGGKAYFDGTTRKYDKLNFIESLIKEGYEIVYDSKGLKEAKKDKLYGLFAPTDMAYDIDRDPVREPSLAEMTEAALKVLSKNQKGFFLMIEGSKVDKACHLNDPVGGLTEFLAFDKALQKAVDFAKKDKHTVVIVCPDHGNGGISIGNVYSNKGKKEDKYSVLAYDKIMKPLIKAKHTVKGIDDILRAEYAKHSSVSKDFINNIVKEYVYDFNNDKKVTNALSKFIDENEKQIHSIKSNYDSYYYAYNNEIDTVLGQYISRKAFLGWTTRGHTGEDVFLAMYHPDRKVLTGLIDNNDIGRYIFKIFGSKEGKLMEN